ncbi:hypothetical protein [Rheinheimera texasensis]|uniref:hypothetical protein n=1 Tax=Rheinheimera texasensis TaxID=306205 RepID=UPI0004E26CD3|nr:hypothetical protein [Rheinheimera texasensis]
MKLDSSLFDTFQQLRGREQNRKLALLNQYSDKIKQQQTYKNGVTSQPDTPMVSVPAKPSTTLTFANISSKQLKQWLEQSGSKLTEEQSGALKALIYSATGGGSKNELTPVNFFEKAQQVLQSAAARKDSTAMLFWANTLSAMKKFEGEALSPKQS